MSQSNFVIADAYISATIPAIQAMLQALASNSLGTAAPSTTYAGQFWLDKTSNTLKMRDAANAAWIIVGTFDFTAGTFSPSLAGDISAAGALSVAGILSAPKAFLPITTGGTSTAYTISTGATAYIDGQNYRFALHATNGASATVRDGSLAAVPFMVDKAGTLSAPGAGQMVANTIVEATYSATSAAMIITGGLFATASDATTGTAIGIPVDPAGVNSAIRGTSSRFESSGHSITPAGSLILAHGLIATPKIVSPYLTCVTAELGYSAGDTVLINPALNSIVDFSYGISVVVDSTNLTIRLGASTSVLQIVRKDTGAAVVITPANWTLGIVAIA